MMTDDDRYYYFGLAHVLGNDLHGRAIWFDSIAFGNFYVGELVAWTT